MNRQHSDSERAAIREMIDSELEQVLGSRYSPDAILELEGAAEMFASTLTDNSAPAGIPELMVEILEERRDDPGTTFLAAIAEIGSDTAAGMVEPALERLEEQDIHPALPPEFGNREIEQVLLHPLGGADLYIVRLRRPGESLAGVGLAVIEYEETDGALVDGTLTTPNEEHEIDQLIDQSSESDADRPAARHVSAEHLTQAMLDAAVRTRELNLAIPPNLSLLLTLVARVMKLDPADLELPTQAEEEADELQLDPGDEERFLEISEGLLHEFGAWIERTHESDGPLSRNGGYFANSMLGWKFNYADRDLGFWSVGDIEEFLLYHAPRKMGLDQESIADGPDCVAGFLYFLEADGYLTGDTLPTLVAHCEAIREGFADAAADQSNWGPAKAMFSQMESEGVDVTDQASLDAWIADFNSRSFEDRDRVLGPGIESGSSGSGTGVAVGWFPPDDFDEAKERWEEIRELWGKSTHAEYCRHIETALRDRLREGATPSLVDLRVSELVAYSDQQGINPVDSRHQFATEMLQRGESRPWPPGRNDPCWCGSGTKYKRCCGR